MTILDYILGENDDFVIRRCMKSSAENISSSKAPKQLQRRLFCSIKPDPSVVKYSIKTIYKDRITSIEPALQIMTEMRALHVLNGHPCITHMKQVLHGPTGVHLVTEYQPFDLVHL